MKTLLKVVGGIVGCLVLLLIVVRITGFGPIGNTPGRGNYRVLWLRGHVDMTPVTDRSFTRPVPDREAATNTWYGIPHSVTTYCVAYNGQLYLISVYPRGVTYPNGRNWNASVARDPHVRIRVGDQIYDRTLTLVTDPPKRQPFSR